MSLIVLMSASGSPGVTTTTLALALGWHRRCLLIEADPTGGSAIAAGYLKGSIVPAEAMIELALAHQDREPLLEVLPQVCHDLPDSPVSWLPGTRSHEQARSLLGLWEPLSAALRALHDTGQDVLVDAGRLGLYGSPEPVIHAADLALLLTRSDLASLSAARSWARTLKDHFEAAGASTALAVMLIGPGEPFTAKEVAKVLNLPVLASVASDRPGAQVLSSGAAPPRPALLDRLAGRDGWAESALLRSYRGARSAITARLNANAASLDADAVLDPAPATPAGTP